MDIVIGVLVFINQNNKSYNSIFVIINRFIKMVYYRSVKVTINVLALAKLIINIVIRYYDLLDSIIINQVLLFTLKF